MSMPRQLHPESNHGTGSDLIDAARRGEEWAWKRLFEEHYPQLFRFFRAYVRGEDEAEERATDVFLQAFRSIALFSGQEEPFEAWLFGIARREYASQPDSRVEDSTVRDEFLQDDVRAVLERLPVELRRALELRLVIGLSSVEAAAAMERSPGTYRKLLVRAARAYRSEARGREPWTRSSGFAPGST